MQQEVQAHPGCLDGADLEANAIYVENMATKLILMVFHQLGLLSCITICLHILSRQGRVARREFLEPVACPQSVIHLEGSQADMAARFRPGVSILGHHHTNKLGRLDHRGLK